MAYTFYKKDDREYAKLAAEIQSYPRHIQFHCDGADYTSPKEHVRFQIFEPMPMDVVAVDQAAENKKIPMGLTAGMENLRLNSEENSYNLKTTELHRNPKKPYQVPRVFRYLTAELAAMNVKIKLGIEHPAKITGS